MPVSKYDNISNTHRHTHTKTHTLFTHTPLKMHFWENISIERYSICLIINGTYKN